MYTLKINGELHQVDVEDDMPLLWVLRDELGKTGTKFGCGIGQCGACTVLIDEEAVRSCSFPVIAAKNSEITTIEGLGSNHPVQLENKITNLCRCGTYVRIRKAIHRSSELIQNQTG